MNIISFGVSFEPCQSEEVLLQSIERKGRTCYKSEDKITLDSSVKFVSGLIKSKHFAMLEHVSLSVLVVCDRGVSHEIVRHRIASYAQESTRYCNYKGCVTFIDPMEHFTNAESMSVWIDAMHFAENRYKQLLALGETPQMARTVLPNSTKTEIWITMNLREWFHFFQLRDIGTTGKPHPQMKEVAGQIYSLFMAYYPVLFGWLKNDK
jgi:thymidylate synthase (FAD)